MIIHNIKSFITVAGFFVGLMFSIFMTTNAIELVVNVILFTMGFYSFANLFIALYIRHLDNNVAQQFPKKGLETELDKMIKDLDKKEEQFMPQKDNFKIIIDKQIDSIEESQK
jgi:hypothetical protein